MPHLYRKLRQFAIKSLPVFFLSFSFLPALAQRPELKRPQEDQNTPTQVIPEKPTKRGARAIAVLEFLPGGSARLVPIALWYEGKYYDASLYRANPEPLALEPGTVYEGRIDGQIAGTFVVNTPKLSNGGWIGDGHWKPYGALDAKLAADAAKHAKPTPKESKAIFTGDADEGPPVLRRPGEQSSSSQKGPTQPTTTASAAAPAAASGTASASGDDPDRPTLRNPSPPPAASGTANASGDDPDRPTLHNSSPPSSTASQAGTQPAHPTPSPDENDPDRPVLARGEPVSSTPKLTPKFPVSGMTPSANTSPGVKSSPGTMRSVVAISDAGKDESRPLVYATTPEQQQLLAKSMVSLALADIRAFAAKHATDPHLLKAATIKDYSLRLFDLDFSNSPTLVLDAKLPLPTAGSKPFVYYATIVARLDINGQPIKIFSSVSDTSHLDVYPRMELVDAVDADANGRGDLLFRQYSDGGISYGLYRIFPYQMEKIFLGGGGI